MKKTYGVLCVALGLFLGVSQSKADSLVTNGGFETGDFTGWTLSGNDVPGGEGNLYGVEAGVDPVAGMAPHSGSFQAYFGDLVSNPTTLSQSVATVPGSQYAVSFFLAQYTLPGSGPTSDIFSASFGGSTLANLTAIPDQGYTEYSFTVDATSSMSTMDLTLGNDNGYFLLDDVSVAPTPEPSTWVFMLTGTIGSVLLWGRNAVAKTAPPPRIQL
jgi:hypothetical protein